MWPDETSPQAAPPQHPRDGGATDLSVSPTRSFNSRSEDTDAPITRSSSSRRPGKGGATGRSTGSTSTWTPPHQINPEGRSTELLASPTRSFSPRCGGADATLPQIGATPTLAQLATETLQLLVRLSKLYNTSTINDGIDWNQKPLMDLVDDNDDTWRMVIHLGEHESLASHGHESRIDGLVTRVVDQLIQSDQDLSGMTEILQDKRLRITESLRPLNKTFNGLQLNSPEYKRLLNSMRAIKCDGINVDLRSGDVYRRSCEVKILCAQLRQYEGSTRSMSHISSWKEAIAESRRLAHSRLDERASLQLDMAQTEAELAGLDSKDTASFQGGFDATEEGVLSQTSCQEDDNSTSHSPKEIEGDIELNGTTIVQVAPPADGTTSHSHSEVEGDAGIKGTAVDQDATTNSTAWTSYPIVKGDATCGGTDVHSFPQEDKCEDDALPPNVTTSTDSPPSGGRESFKFILTKSGMDHKPVSLIQTTAAALPRQKTSPSCAPSLMAPANNITTPMTGGQGKGAPAKAPPRQLILQLGRRGTQNQIMILQRAGGLCEPTRAPHVTAPASESPKGGDQKKTKKNGGKKRSQIEERERGAPAPPPSHVPASRAPPVSDTTAGSRRLHPPSSTRRLWTAGSRRKSTPTVTVPRHELAQLRQSKRDLQMLTWRYACLRQAHHRLTQEIDQSTAAVPIHGEDDDDDDDDDEATVATSNLTGIDSCENVPAQLDDGDDDDDVTPASEDDVADGMDGDTYGGGAPVYRDCPNNLQSVHTAPLLAFGLAPATTDDIRQIETNNLQQSQDIEGLPLVPKRKRRRKRKRKRPRRRKGQANKPRPKHSPVTPPRRHTNVRRQAAKTAKTHESFPKEFQAYFYSNAAKYCPASGFDTNWHRKGIG